MSLFRFLWLKRIIRSNMNPIPESKAILWKRRLSVAYMIVCWNAFGLVGYMIYAGKADWAAYYGLKSEEETKLSTGQEWVKTLGKKHSDIYRVEGFTVTKIDNPENKAEITQTDDIST